MTKAHTTLTLDIDIIEKCKALQINISGECQKFLEKVVNTYQNDIEGVNLELLNIEIVRLKNQKMKIDMELQNKLRTKEMLEEIIKKKEETKLQEEKEQIENANRCDNCKEIKSDQMKMHTFGNKKICNSCFMSSTKDKTKEWTKE